MLVCARVCKHVCTRVSAHYLSSLLQRATLLLNSSFESGSRGGVCVCMCVCECASVRHWLRDNTLYMRYTSLWPDKHRMIAFSHTDKLQAPGPYWIYIFDIHLAGIVPHGIKYPRRFPLKTGKKQ